MTTTHAGEALPTIVAHDSTESGGTLLALCQTAPVLGGLEANIARHAAICAELSSRGVELVIFPELSLTGYFLKDLVTDVSLQEPFAVLAPIRDALGDSTAIVGGVFESREHCFYNAAFLLTKTETSVLHAKVYLPTYGLFDEYRYFTNGKGFHARDLELPSRWRIGTLICEDLWHLESVAGLTAQGVDLLVGISASPARGVGEPHGLGTESSYDALTRTYALLSTSYVAYCNRVGYEDGIAFWGGSRIVGPDGRILGEPGGTEEEIHLHTVSQHAVRRARIATPLRRDASLFDPAENA